MKKPFMEVIRFDSSDVILTSGGHSVSGHSVNGLSVYCPADHNQFMDEHFIVEGFHYDDVYQCYTADGHSYYNGYTHSSYNLYSFDFKDEQFPTQEDIGNWYYYNSNGEYELCNSGQ